MKQWQHLSESDLHIAFALSRPGVGDEYRDLFYDQLRIGTGFSYGHPQVDEILSESYGVAVFQEQIMMLASAIGGFDPWQADTVRRQLSKERDPAKLQQTAKLFFTNAISQGLSEQTAQMLVDQMMHFSKYGFVKGHAIALMSNIAYKLAWLKMKDPISYKSEVQKLKKGHYFIRGNPEAYELEEN